MNKETLNEFYKYAYSLTLNEQDAYDLVQEAITRLLTGKDTRLHEKFFVFRVIKNLYLDSHRKAAHRLEIADSQPEEAPLESEICFSEIIIGNQNIDFILGKLNAEDRDLIFLKEIAGLTADELAIQESKPRGTILNKLFRIKKKLQKMLSDPGLEKKKEVGP